MATKQQEQTYEKIMQLYDLAEGVIDVVEFEEEVQPKDAYVPMVEELIEQVEESTEVLAQTYIMFVETDKKPNALQRRKVEGAFSRMEKAITKFREKHQHMKETNDVH